MRHKRKTIVLLAFLIAPLLINHSLFADETTKEIISDSFSKKRDVCHVIRSLVAEGGNTKEIVKTSIQMGYGACLVVKCAIQGGGNSEQIISGATDAGAISDDVLQCALDAGVKPEEVVKIQGKTSSTAPKGLPEWKFLMVGLNNTLVYYDAQNISYPTPDTVRVSAIEVFPEGGEFINGKVVREDMLLWEIMCSAKQIKLLSITQFDSEKNVLRTEMHKVAIWSYIEPESIADKLYKLVCP